MTLTHTHFQKRLLNWFDHFGRKDLPWQINKTPYRVWVSESMLQQTQVQTVIPYYERFMMALPSLADLADASTDTIMHLWAGLGYYSRARNLHRAAQMIMTRFHGQFPSELESMLELPGIGPSTAGAISAIAFNMPATILDGNVKRVLSRLHGITSPINEKHTEAVLWEIATSYTPKKRVADYTQAIMDLGATLCVKKRPACHACPFNDVCFAYREHMTDTLPMTSSRKPLPKKTATFLFIRANNHYYFVKRPEPGLWGGLWSVPELTDAADPQTVTAHCEQLFNVPVKAITPLPIYPHVFSHYHLTIHPCVIDLARKPRRRLDPDSQIWYNPDKRASIGWPKPITDLMSMLT